MTRIDITVASDLGNVEIQLDRTPRALVRVALDSDKRRDLTEHLEQAFTAVRAAYGIKEGT